MSLYTLAFVGIVPLGSILAGGLADLIGAGMAQATMSSAGIALGLVAARFDIPALREVETPEFSVERTAPLHPETVGGPVMVVNTWVVDQDRVDQFLELMTRIRDIRMKTGSYRWRLYRNASNPRRLSEVFLCISWDEHLAQHRRIDDSSRQVLVSARDFDVSSNPTSYHLIAVDMEESADWDALMDAHATYHRFDGSVPLIDPVHPD